MIDREKVSRALAKALAYKQCGQQMQAEAWAAELVRLLECADVLAASGREEIMTLSQHIAAETVRADAEAMPGFNG